ncbi:serine/threonine-protein phosphatase [Candidatus Atribacteria bacterium HGW-Atribacteria-1]|nr:MAG: serine/threonine-protein phosphatase [Candidatus Atribacteria bacterium HGW-Atribacteria-1]
MNKYYTAGLTDIGKLREENQDAFFIDQEWGFYLVVDGMGGMQNGALAAHYVKDNLFMLLKKRLTNLQESDSQDIIIAMKEVVSVLSKNLREKVGKDTGAAFVSALLKGKVAYIAHLGDCRVYLFRQDAIKILTKDHNLAALLVDLKKITPEEARSHPMRNRLTAYLGMEGKAFPEVKQITLQPGDRLLLCSDGLTGMLPETEISALLGEKENPKKALKKLITRANEAGGNDNITGVLIDFQ